MIAIMQASPEELLLLLKKWESESKRLIGVCIVRPDTGFSAVSRVSGFVRVDESSDTFSIGDVKGDFLLCKFSSTAIGYKVGSDLDWSEFADEAIKPEEVEDFVVLRNADLSSIAIYCLASQ